MSVSLWQRSGSPERMEVDLAIVGAGIAGLSAALEGVRRGLRVLVLERSGVGAGASGRNAGYLMRGAADNYAAAVDAYGRDAARALWRFSEENLADLRREGIEKVVGFAPRESCLLALEDDEAAALQRSIALLREDGFAVEPLELGSGGDAIARHRRARGGLVNPDDAVCDPMRVLEWLASRLPAGVLRCGMGCGGVVHAIEPLEGGGVLVLSNGLEVVSERALVCANGWLGRLVGGLAGVVVANRGQMLALRIPSDALRIDRAYYANHGGEYFRRVDDATVIVGGCRRLFEGEERTDSDGTSAGVQRALEVFSEEMFGGRYPVVARWAGTMAFTPDHLPVTGRVPLAARDGGGGVGGEGGEAGARPGGPDVWVCGGFTGHGMSLGFRAARETVRAMLGGGDGVRAVVGGDARGDGHGDGPFPVGRLRGV